MSLPKLETPTYKIKLPSTGKMVEFRPFLVKEEKLLLMMSEGKNTKETNALIKKLLKSCVLTDLDVEQLTTFDLEYLFISLRSKSVGEEVSLIVKCENCETQCPCEVNLDEDVFVQEGEKIDFKIPISNNIGIEMRYPTINDISDEMSPIELLSNCIKNIYDDSTVHDVSDYTNREIQEFVESLSMKDIQKIQKFFESLPKVKCKLNFTCQNCETENKLEVEGINNFF